MKRDYWKTALAALVLLALPLQMKAVVAKPGTGLYGDEYHHYRKDASGRICAPSEQNSVLRRMPQIESTFPTQGDVRSLVILVNFSDVSFTIPNARSTFSNMLNLAGYSDYGGTGSARDYFLASSNNLFRPTIDVYGPVTLPHNRAYYGGADGDAVKMVTDACDLLENEIDWTLYDENKDGQVDNIFIYFAGHNEAEGGPEEAVWPHRYYVFTEDNEHTVRYYYKGKDGKKYWLWDYACTSELSGEYGTNICGIGTFCHEFSHVLGLDDHYDTQNSENYTVGAWDIMCYGNYNNDGRTPPSFTAFERFMLGWLVPEQLFETKDCVLEPIETSYKAYLIASKEHNLTAGSPNPIEYWLVENRQRVGWDEPKGCLAGTGLLISHIYWNKRRWDNNTPNNAKPFVFDICEAWYQNPSTTTASDTYPGQYNVTQFVPSGVDGELLSEHTLSNIQVFGTSVAFHHGEITNAGLVFSPAAPPTIHSTLLNGRRYETGVDIVQLEGKGVQDSVVNISVNVAMFEISLDSINWSASVTIRATADSTCQATIYVRYKPSGICSGTSAMLYAQTANKHQFAQVKITGESSRAVIIKPVQAIEADSITPYGFTAQWEPQEDAEEYLLTVYRINPEPKTLNYRPNLRMAKTGTTYQTDYALLPLSNLSVSIGQTFGSDKNDYRGCVLIDALTGEQEWKNVDSIPVRSLSSTIQREYTFTNEQDYHRFRLTYNTLSGSHYATLTGLSYTLSAQPIYVFADTAVTVLAPANKYAVKDLQAGTEYHYTLRAAEEKGCTRQVTRPGNSIQVRTIQTSGNNNQFVISNRNHILTAYLTEQAAANSELRVFNTTGTLLYTYPLEKGTNICVLPSEGLVQGQIYLVKYCTEDKISRKEMWSKFIY